MTRGYVDTRWGQVHYVDQGHSAAGAPTLVLLHETPQNAAAYAKLQPLLADRYRVVAFDTPGYGNSDPPPALTTIPEYATTFAEAFDRLGLGDIAVVAAHTGCCYAIELASSTMPGRVRALVLAGVPLYPDDVRAGKLANIPKVKPLNEDGSHFLDAWGAANYPLDVERRTRTITSIFEHPATAYSAYHAVFSYDTAAALPAVECPLLLLDTALDSLAAADDRVLELAPHAEHQRIEARTLPVYWTEAEEFARRALDWLGSHL